MRVKIWGARGSVPSPLRPAEVREQIITAILGISQIGDEGLKEELIKAILEQPPLTEDAGQAGRRKAVETYLDSSSSLFGSTAGGNTPCIEVKVDQDLFIIDAGSGIRELGLKLMEGNCGQGKGVLHLLFSHPHWDHIQGFPFFRPAFIPGNKIFIYSAHDLEAALRRQQESISFPISLDYMQADMTFIQIKPEEVLEFGDLRIRSLKNEHPGDSYSFRFEKGDKVFVYASDAAYPAGLDLRPHLNFFAEANLLIYDAQFTQRESDEKEDWGHSSSFVGVEMAQQAKVKSLLLFHYDPTYADADLEKILEDTLKFQQTQYPDQTPVQVMIAQEGQTFDLRPAHAFQLQQVPGSKIAILQPSGIFNERVVIELQEQFLNLQKFNGPKHLIVDMSDVERLQVTGLRALVKLSKDQTGTSIALAGPTTNTQQLIELAGYLDFFTIYPSIHTAISTLQAHETLNLPGQLIKNRYYIEAKMGDGRLGTVFKATDTRLNRPVAIKILSHAFSEGAIEQFIQHGRQIVDLSHPYIVEVYDCDRDHGLSFMVEELLETDTLRDLIEQNPGRPLPFDVGLSIAQNVAQALEYAHGRGVIHGDLKPKNVLLAEEVKVSDFGLGRLESGKSPLTVDVPLDLVTAHYLAPEQVLGHPIDARTDLYTLGVVLYEMFTGRRPFEGTDQEVMEHHRHSKPTPPSRFNPALSDSMEHLILKLLDKDPNQRYSNARQTRRILASMTTLTSGEIQSAAFGPLLRRPLVARQESLQQLLNLWAKTGQGQGQLVFITGEAGLGKTRLIEELTFHLGRATLLVATGQKRDGGRAYQPFIGAITDYFAGRSATDDGSEYVNDSPVGKVLGHIAQEIPEIEPMIRHIMGDSQAEPANRTEDSPNPSLFSLTELLAHVTTDHPWLLVLDDLDRFDGHSLKLLLYLAHHCLAMKLMIVGLYDEDALVDNDVLSETLATMGQQVTYTSIKLEHLTESEVTALLNNIWSQTVPPGFAAAVYRRTDGNPLHVEETAKLLTDEGVVTWRNGRWHFGPVVEVTLPRHTRDAILRRVSRLPLDSQAVLNQAAILGPSFSFAALQELSPLSGSNPFESLDILLERQLIRQSPGDKNLHFSHTESQHALYENLTSLKRRSLHREVGEALERCYSDQLTNVVEDLAYHFLLAGELEKGLTYSVEAARQAETMYANRSALGWYTQALDALEQLGLDDKTRPQQFDLLLAREQSYDSLGQRQAQAADLTALGGLAQAFDDPGKQALVYSMQAGFQRASGRLNQATAIAEAGLTAARQAGDPVLEAEILLQLASVATSQGRFENAQEHLDTAHGLLTRADRLDSQARLLHQLATISRYLNDYHRADSLCQQALAINKTIGSRRGQSDLLNTWGLIQLDMGHYAQATSCLQQSMEIYRIIGNRHGEATCLNNLARTYRELGHLEMAQQYLEAALAIHYSIEDQQGKAKDRRILSTINLARGDYLTARDNAGEALEIFQRLAVRPLEGFTWLELGLALEALGDLAKAEAAYSQAKKVQGELGNEAGALDAKAGLARCLLATGKTAQATKEVEICLAEIEAQGATGMKYPVRLYLTAYWVLQAADNKERAVAALREGCKLLKERAKTIEDPRLRDRFIKDVPENKELATQLQQYEPS